MRYFIPSGTQNWKSIVFVGVVAAALYLTMKQSNEAQGVFKYSVLKGFFTHDSEPEGPSFRAVRLSLLLFSLRYLREIQLAIRGTTFQRQGKESKQCC